MTDGLRINAQLLVGTHHAVGFHTADLADLDGKGLGVAGLQGQRGSRKNERNLISRLEVLRTANDLAFALAIGDPTDGELVGVGMFVAGEDLSHNHAVELAGQAHNAFDLETQQRETLGEFFRGPVEVHIIAEPVEGHFHGQKR